jgi:riboflavin kinase/FMN adenylyltransferase
MEIISDVTSLRRKRSPIVMAAGFFDGVHVGHRKVICSTVASAASMGGKSWILTFDRHPLSIINPKLAPSLLTTSEQRLELLRRLNVDGCLIIPFTKELAQSKPEDFVEGLLKNIPALKKVLVGRNWRFGRNGAGTPAMLSGICRESDIDVAVVGSIKKKGIVVSSTSIRTAVAKGELRVASALLGRDYSFTGNVVKGRTIGRKLGYPTANIDAGIEVLLPRGVYAVLVQVGVRGRKLLNGILNYGTRPTFNKGGKDALSLEIHLFDMSRDLYGKHMEVFVKARIRGEERFASPERLQCQIMKDVKKAKKIL